MPELVFWLPCVGCSIRLSSSFSLLFGSLLGLWRIGGWGRGFAWSGLWAPNALQIWHPAPLYTQVQRSPTVGKPTEWMPLSSQGHWQACGRTPWLGVPLASAGGLLGRNVTVNRAVASLAAGRFPTCRKSIMVIIWCIKQPSSRCCPKPPNLSRYPVLEMPLVIISSGEPSAGAVGCILLDMAMRTDWKNTPFFCPANSACAPRLPPPKLPVPRSNIGSDAWDAIWETNAVRAFDWARTALAKWSWDLNRPGWVGWTSLGGYQLPWPLLKSGGTAEGRWDSLAQKGLCRGVAWVLASSSSSLVAAVWWPRSGPAESVLRWLGSTPEGTCNGCYCWTLFCRRRPPWTKRCGLCGFSGSGRSRRNGLLHWRLLT